MNSKLILLLFVVSAQLAGCTTLYQYRSDGELSAQNGTKQKAVLYWYGEEGRLWYGKKYAQLDSGLNLRICKVGIKPFDLSKTSRLELPAKANDIRVADLDDQGALHPVAPPVRLRTGDYCGIVLLNGQAVTTEKLRITLHPSIAILCKSLRNPDRYPQPDIYAFGAISRSETSKDNRNAPDPCLAP
jgi:hypothetical protein